MSDENSSCEDDEESVGDESTNLQHAKKIRGQYRMKNNIETNQITGKIPTTSANKINMRKMKSFAEYDLLNQLAFDKSDTQSVHKAGSVAGASSKVFNHIKVVSKNRLRNILNTPISSNT